MGMYRHIFLYLFFSCTMMFGLPVLTTAQNCPPNIDFEDGSFSNWTCLAGITKTTGISNLINMSPSSSGPLPDRHRIISRISSSGELDHYGEFPVVCPNGSNYSVKLGNNRGKHEAEGISYDFTIPADRNTYSLIYHYAVVFQNSDHKQHEQPRLEIEIKNVTDNKTIDCSSVSFVAYGTPLPGFFISPKEDSVWCKDWTAVTVNLNGYAGKDIRLTFKTADCVFQGHFGYAYIDVDANCAEAYTGSAFCKDDTVIHVAGPYGFAGYKWFNQNLTAELGSDRVLTFRPPPPSGTTFALELLPFNGYGCADTVFIELTDTLTLRAKAGNDVLLCGNNSFASLGEVPRPGVVYTWSPAAGLSDPAIANPIVNTQGQQRYILSVANNGGGCKASDTVLVFKSITDTTLTLLGKSNMCITSGDSAVLVVNAANKIQWYKDESLLPGEDKARYRVIQPGRYYARLQNSDGCAGITPTKIINIESAAPGKTYPLIVSLANSPVTLTARNFGEVKWSPGFNLDDPFSKTPVYTASAESDLTYEITITTEAGCVTTDYQPVKTLKEINVFVPGGFTPNGDGKHEYLRPVGFGANPTVFNIYDRWGRLMFSINQNAKGWDGTFKGVPQDAGTYVWYLTATGIDGKKYSKKGTVVLLR